MRSALAALLLCLGMVQLHAAEPTSVWIVVLRVGAYGYSGTIVPDEPSNFKAYASEAACLASAQPFAAACRFHQWQRSKRCHAESWSLENNGKRTNGMAGRS